MIAKHPKALTRCASWRIAMTFLVLSTGAGCVARPGDQASSSARLMTPREFQALPSRAPDLRIPYGNDASQYGELRLPAGPGPHPVAVLIHGGCFKAAYATLRDLSPMADALVTMGVATWNIEYRRLGEPGGGWPETYLDVGRAVDHLRDLAAPHALDLARVVVVGHSAGGHLAMWAAGRARIDPGTDLHVADPLPVRGVLNLAGPIDLAANASRYQSLCRDWVITALLGGTPETAPERYAQASAIQRLPLGLPQVLVIGEYEEFLPRPLAEAYAHAAAEAGDKVRLMIFTRAGHFEIASPYAMTWPYVGSAIRSLLDGQLPPDDAVNSTGTLP
jgi:acetyl esterase/lipase